jgi:hypothetical protein
MSVYKYHAFIFLVQPPPWQSETTPNMDYSGYLTENKQYTKITLGLLSGSTGWFCRNSRGYTGLGQSWCAFLHTFERGLVFWAGSRGLVPCSWLSTCRQGPVFPFSSSPNIILFFVCIVNYVLHSDLFSGKIFCFLLTEVDVLRIFDEQDAMCMYYGDDANCFWGFSIDPEDFSWFW